MALEEVRIAIAFVGVAAATLFDVFNKRNVPNWLTYALVGLGFLVNLYAFDLALFSQALLVALAIFALGYLLYREGQIGGADVLVFAALALLLPQAPSVFLGEAQAAYAGLPFVVSIFVYSGMLFLVFFALKSIPLVARAIAAGKARIGLQSAAYALLVLVFYFVFFQTAGAYGLSAAYMAVISFVVACALFIAAFKDAITDSLIEEVPLSRVDDEDVLAIEKMDPKVVKKYGLKKLLTKEEIRRLKKLPVKKFPVFTRLPVFLPFVLLALLIALKYGDAVGLLVRLALTGGV